MTSTTPTNQSQSVEPAEEPNVTQEESVPVDKPDKKGEAMMKQVRNERMADPGEQSRDETRDEAGADDGQTPDKEQT